MKVMCKCCTFFFITICENLSRATRVMWFRLCPFMVRYPSLQLRHVSMKWEWFSPDVSKENRRCQEEIDYLVRLLPTIRQDWSFLCILFMIYVPLEVSQVKWFWVILDLRSDFASLCTRFFLVLKTQWIDFPLEDPSVLLLSFVPSHAR